MWLQVDDPEKEPRYHRGHRTTLGNAHTSHGSLVDYLVQGCEMFYSTTHVFLCLLLTWCGIYRDSGIPLSSFVSVPYSSLVLCSYILAWVIFFYISVFFFFLAIRCCVNELWRSYIFLYLSSLLLCFSSLVSSCVWISRCSFSFVSVGETRYI